MVSAQLGRAPRGEWSVASRCSRGRSSAILTAPAITERSPFPTLYWLTCPWLGQHVDRLESAGGTDHWADRLAREPDLAAELLRVDAEYRLRRAALVSGDDALGGVGIAGQSDPLATKCLHAHVANFLAGLDDPIGREILADLGTSDCPDDACAAHATEMA